MKLERKSLLSTLKNLKNFAGDDKTPMPVLKLVHLENVDSQLVMKVSNGTLFAKAYYSVEDDTEINFYIPIGKLVEALEKLSSDLIEIKFQNNKVSVRGGKNTLSISGMDECIEFPIISEMPTDSVRLDTEMFWSKIDSVALCADPRHANLILRCLTLKSDGDLITLGATNLVASAMNFIKVKSPEFKTAVGLDFLKAAKALSKNEKELSLAFDNGKLYLSIGCFEVGTISIVNQIPNLQRAFEIDGDCFSFSFNTADAGAAMELASMFAKENELKPDFVKLSAVEDGEIRVYAESESGYSDATFEAFGEFKGIHGFNVTYFLAMCGLFDKIRCEHTELNKSKLLFTSDEDKDWIMLISPMT